MAGFLEIKEEIKKAVEVLNGGGTILYPTDTIWGLGCDATQEEAVQKLLKIKNRPQDKGLIVLVSSINELDRYVEDVPSMAFDLLEYAEHPLTLVLEKGRKISPTVLKENQSIAIRVVKTGICHELLKVFKKPLVSTSANISGEPSPKTFEEISQVLKDRVDLIFSKETSGLFSTKPSTIIRLDNNGTIEFLRR